MTNIGMVGIDNDLSSYRLFVTLSAAFVGAILSCLASQPGDTLLSAVNQSARQSTLEVLPNSNNNNNNNNMNPINDFDPVKIMIESAQKLGIRGLFRGTKARLLHSTIIVVSQLLIYDTIKQVLGIAGAGTH